MIVPKAPRALIALIALGTGIFAGHAPADTVRVLDVGDSWAFFPYALQSPPALEEVLARPEFGLDGILEDGSIGLTNIFAEGWDTPEQFAKIADRLDALPTTDICHVSLGGNDFVHGWKQVMTPEEVDTLLDVIVGHIRNVVQFCLDTRPDVRVAVVGYDYINLYDGFKINAQNQVWDYESITHWAVTYWGYPIPQTKQQVLTIISEVHEVWIELERRKLAMTQEFEGRVTYVHNLGSVQHTFGVASAGVAPGVVGIPDGPENGFANFPNGRADLYNPRSVMKIDDGEMDPLHLNSEGFLAFYENIVRQCYLGWLSDSTPPQVADIRPLPASQNPTDAAAVVFEVRFSEAVTGVDLSDFSLRTSESIAGGTIQSITGSGTTYQVTVAGYSGTGTVAIDLVDDDSIYDAVWYPLRRLSDGSFLTGAPYWIDSGTLSCAFAQTLDAQGAALFAGPLAADWATADLDSDGIPDRFAVALLGRLICETGHPQHAAAQAAFDANRATLNGEAGLAGFVGQADVIAALCTVSEDVRDAVDAALGLAGAYVPWEADGDAVLGALGDPDDDDRSNLLEYDWVDDLGGGRQEYAITASTAGLGPKPGPACPDQTIYDTQGQAFYLELDPQLDWELIDLGANGIPDRFEIALLAWVLCDAQHPLHDPLQLLYEDNLELLTGTPYEAYKDYLALLAASSQALADELIAALTLPANLVGLIEAPFAPDSDADGDGETNRREYVWAFIRGGGPDIYAEEATNATEVPNAALPNCDYAFTFESQGDDFYNFAFQIGAWQIADVDQSTIPDRYEISVLAAILCDDTYSGHNEILAAYEANLASLRAETVIPFLTPVLDIMAALATLSQPFGQLLKGAFALENTYASFRISSLDPLSALGDIDGDMVENYLEFEALGGTDATVPEYVRAVLGAQYPPAPELTVAELDTNDAQPAISGSARYALIVEWSLDNQNWFPVPVRDEEWSFVPPAPLEDGVYDVHVRATGAFQRNGADTTTDELIIDTEAPTIDIVGENRIIAEAGEPFVDPGASASDARDGDITDRLNVLNSVDTSLIDAFTVLYNVRDRAGNPATPVQRIVEVRDRTKPILTLNGLETMETGMGVPFDDPGATAFDSFSGDISDDVVVSGFVDDSAPGIYILQYDVRDGNRNDADPVTRSVEVTDVLAPVITLLGDNPFLHPALTPFVDPGATALDDTDGDVTLGLQSVADVNPNVVGSYSVQFSVSDLAGNLGQATRVVQVFDATPPVITLLGDDPQTHVAGTPYVDPGATASDFPQGDISGTIVVTNTVDVNTVGSYTVTYNVTDSAGNAAEPVVRAVSVVDTGVPVISLVGEASISISCRVEFDDPGATATDSISGDLTSSILVDVEQVNPNLFILTYSVSDPSGNAAEPKTREVTITDDCANTADPDGDFIVSLSELLRVIQFYNAGGLHCADEPGATEDGYVSGAGENESCVPYDADYLPQNWIINLSELLRIVQFYNSGAYTFCPDENTEDGFCPGIG